MGRRGRPTRSDTLRRLPLARWRPLDRLPEGLLPAGAGGFHRIRHYGFLANGARAERLARCRWLLDVPVTSVGAESPDAHDAYELTWRDFAVCPVCGGAMQRIASVPRSTRPFRCDTS